MREWFGGLWQPAKVNPPQYDLMDKDTTVKLGIYLQLPSDVGQVTYLLCFCFLFTFCLSVYSGRQNWHLPF